MNTIEELPIEKILRCLKQIKQKYSNTNELGLNQWQATCPYHHGKEVILTITECLNDNVILYCSAGCHIEKIIDSMQLQPDGLLKSK